MQRPPTRALSLRTLLVRLLSPLVFVATAAPAQAEGDSPQLKPFRATYSASLNGMPLGANISLELSGGQPEWTLALAGSSALVKYREETRFRWQDCAAMPVRYRYDFSGFGISRKLWLDFNHATRRVTGESRKGPLSYAVGDDVTDELSLTMIARCRFANGSPLATFNVATTKGLRQLSYRMVARETVKTPWGKVEALRVERVRNEDDKRQSTLWIAPSLDYVMVKMEHVEKLGVRGSVVLKTLEMAADAMAPATTSAAP